MPQKEFNVLAIVQPAGPHAESAAGTAWMWLRALSAHHRLTVLTDANRRAAIEADFQRNPALPERLAVHFLSCREKRFARLLPRYACRYQQDWHRLALERAKQLMRWQKFDLVHQFDTDGYRGPGLAWQLDCPFVWGPMGEILNADLRLWPFLGCRGVAHYLLFNLINTWELRRSPHMRRAFERACGLIATGRRQQRKIEEVSGRACVVLPGFCPTDGKHEISPHAPAGGPLRIVWSAPHVHRSGLPILLQALARLPLDVTYRVEILGSGPLFNVWRRLAKRLKVDRYCCWHGPLPEDDARQVMRHSHVLAATSIKDDSAAGSAIDALAAGLPVIYLENSNAADIVDETCGIEVAGTRPLFIVYDYARALAGLSRNVHQLAALKEAAPRRAAEFSCRRQVERMADLYEQAVDRWLSRANKR